MLSKSRAKFTYSNIVSTLCLFMLLGGSAYAAATVTGKNIKNSSITGKDVKNRSLTKKDFRGSVRGRQGPSGAPGVNGASGISGLQRVFVASAIDSNTTKAVTATCPPGKSAIGGGADVDGVDANGAVNNAIPDVFLNRTLGGADSWQATAHEDDIGYDGLWRLEVTAICAVVQ